MKFLLLALFPIFSSAHYIVESYVCYDLNQRHTIEAIPEFGEIFVSHESQIEPIEHITGLEVEYWDIDLCGDSRKLVDFKDSLGNLVLSVLPTCDGQWIGTVLKSGKRYYNLSCVKW